MEFYFNDNCIRVGKSSKENWNLIDESKSCDIWLHLKDVPSSHVIISMNKKYKKNNSMMNNCIEYASRLCCIQSSNKIKDKNKVAIIYIKRKYVKKGNVEGEAILLKTPNEIIVENPNYIEKQKKYDNTYIS